MSFANQVAVVTGASSGMGWEVAKELARKRCAVGVVARRQDRLETLVKEIQAAGGKAAWAVADVADRGETMSAIHSLRDQLGPVDLLIANSGIGISTTVEPFNVDDIEQMFKVNTLGVVHAVAAVLPEMLQRGKGHLAAVSSLAAHFAIPGESGYCGSKTAVNVFFDSLRVQLRNRGVHVTTLCPGFVATPMTANNTFWMPWLLTAEQAAKKMVWAIARKKKVYNFPWQLSLLVKSANWLPDWILVRAYKDIANARTAGVFANQNEPRPSESALSGAP